MSLKSIRNMRHLTQEDVANYLHITRAAYTNIENGKRQLDAATIIKLSDVLNVSADEILDLQKKPAVSDGRLDEELVNLLLDLSPSELQRAKDFVAGLKAARTKDASPQV